MSWEKISFEVGIDESVISGMAEEFYTRVMVVLHGNQGGGPIWTKPGMQTFSKHVLSKRESRAREPARPLPFFDQPGDRAGAMLDNAMKEIEHVFNDAIAAVAAAISDGFLARFIHVG